MGQPPLRLSKKSLDFFDSLQNAVTFVPPGGTKVLAALAVSLARQGLRGIRSHSRRAAAPSSSPAQTQVFSTSQRFFDRLTRNGLSGQGSGQNSAVPLLDEGHELLFKLGQILVGTALVGADGLQNILSRGLQLPVGV